ncbi:carboxymuconolactone decarboxylase family protein [Mucilaginibacter paludis]|uniref:Short-chain dehydrogenase/reductase n=1 Tax=Mucilaginibacter paludis DSM 18603 TaxID=714943 RepID=H1Y2G7_9SPHI|nr:carboxymuconolactone decarboxylase family protein [Mucilaginibacter paludis]EHQ28015.1 short-chain dehydrogenase/reductase [Mucilaginibacter paludis DSM 18603]
MTKGFRVVEYADASDEVKIIYNETMKELGVPFVLNWFKCQGSNATILRGNWEKLRCTMLLGNIPFILKQLIIYNISKIKGSKYCAYTHGVIANSMSKTLTGNDDIKLTENMESDYVPSAYKTAIQVVTKCALDPKGTSDSDFGALRDEGYSLDEIQELMALADLTNMLNSLADIAGIQIDNELMEVQ